MSWSIGFDRKWNRDIGYGVPAVCDHPDCSEEIHRGLSYVCGGEPYGGEHGCGLYFCGSHLWYAGERRDGAQMCRKCLGGRRWGSYKAKPDVAEWVNHKETDPSWERWRQERKSAERASTAPSPTEAPDRINRKDPS